MNAPSISTDPAGARLRSRPKRAALLVAAVIAIGVGPGAAGLVGPAQAALGTTITLTGHGYGHGRGMGQYGALGYALNGWQYGRILDHYYGGTSTGHVDPTSPITVDMTSRDGLDTVVVQERGEMQTIPPVNLGCTTGSACAVRIVRNGASNFTVYAGTICTGGGSGWRVVASNISTGAITVHDTVGGEDRRDMLQLCESDDARWLRGDLIAQDTGTSQATVNSVAIDSYVRGVVPREEPADWGTLGGGAGEQALEAQAVAARSYALASQYAPYAKTCDTNSCQVYGGRAVQTSDGTFTDLEGTATYAPSDQAVRATAGESRLLGGTPALTEFSSSTGGYTAGGMFPAVPDDGDATPSNPDHTWTDQLAVSDIAQAFGNGKGQLNAIDITSRNGLGDLGGRVASMDLHFDGGVVTVTGDDFAGALGLRSNWFGITPSGTVPPPPTGPSQRYDVVTVDGTVFGFGGATTVRGLAPTAVSLATTNGGLWVLSSDGSVHATGSAQTYGSVAGMALNRPPLQIAASPSGHGYWIVAGDGGVFSFGDAGFFGSTGAMRLNQPVVGMAPTPTGAGYWLVAADGGIFSFGDARFFGSTGAIRLNQPVVAMAASVDGAGYWLLATDGGVFTFGDAGYAGSLPGLGVRERGVGIARSRTGGGYLVATAEGHVYGFGDAATSGGPADVGAAEPAAGIALVP